MYSVTQRIKSIKQPRGGYINPRMFEVFQLDSYETLNEAENISPIIVGEVVDYLTRFMLGSSLEDAFKISLIGAYQAKELKKASSFLVNIKGLDDNSIFNASKLAGYDVVFRAGLVFYKGVDQINPDKNTINNIRVMVNRSLKFFNDWGPVTLDSPTFEGGYSETVSTGDADFLTKDTLWDMKVSKNKHTSKHTLQLLMYYLMGKRSIHKEFESVDTIGFLNPRMNTISVLKVKNIEQNTIDIVSKEVLGYN